MNIYNIVGLVSGYPGAMMKCRSDLQQSTDLREEFIHVNIIQLFRFEWILPVHRQNHLPCRRHVENIASKNSAMPYYTA